MFKPTPARRWLAALAVAALPTFAAAQQSPEEQRQRVEEMAAQISEVMSQLNQHSQGYEPLMEELRQGRLNYEQADETVNDLIAQLTEATDRMEDGSEFDQAIDDYKDLTSQLIGEAEASNNAAIQRAIPNLEAILQRYEDNDDVRARTVIQARNVIRTLEQNREALAFFIRAGQVQLAADLIEESIGDFREVVNAGAALAGSMSTGVNP